MKIKENYSLKSLNTFGLKVDAKYFTEVASLDEIKQAAEFVQKRAVPLLVLGGGSNILFVNNFSGLVLRNNLKGISMIDEAKGSVIVKVMGGEVWDDFVKFSVENGLGGVENLSLIPGSVGAGPIQNIGAYGIEIKDSFVELEAYFWKTGETKTFLKKECEFGYRNSIFKKELKGEIIIISVTFTLDKKPILKTDYGAIENELAAIANRKVTVQDVRDAIIKIRRSKLPDPNELGNAGSFFKNPVVSSAKLSELKTEFPEIVSYKQPDGCYKLAAGWLIDKCGWKGIRTGDAGVHKRQALVLANYGKASGKDILNLAKKIRESVVNKFGVDLEMEVNVVNS
jgi:UDP-N-acetylmuramate dehydrogenase